MLLHCHRVLLQHGLVSTVFRRSIQISVCCNKNIRAGVQKISRYQDKRLTYEEACRPEDIGVKKSWTSWNTSNLDGETDRRAETTLEDMLIRKFIGGTWINPCSFVSPVIIKRRQNIILISGIVRTGYITSRKEVYFLKGFTEELLGSYLKRPVRMELQAVQHRNELVVKKI